MSTAEPWSARWSDRVEARRTNRDVMGDERAAKAPETVAPSASFGAVAERRPRRVSARRLSRLERDLSDRERGVLASLAAFRFLSTGQLQHLHFVDHATAGAASRICRRVLARLAALGVIAHLERRIGGLRAGSAAYVWRVGPVGDRLLREARGEGSRARHKEPSWRFLEHCLAVADCYLALVDAARCGRLELVAYQTEPACWRPYLGPHGALETLKPDLYAVTASAEFEDSWFIEVDRGTESLPTLMRKCAQYARYRHTGREQAARGVFPAVLWVVPDEGRAQALARRVRQVYGPEQDWFRVTTTAAFTTAVVGDAE